MTYENVRNQITNLKQYPIVQKMQETNSIKIHGWFFDFSKSVVYELNQKENDFVSIVPVEDLSGVSS